MPDLGRLIDDHDALDALADKLIAVSRERSADAEACAAALRDLADRLTTHLAIEGDILFGSHAPTLAREYASFEGGFAELTANWAVYLDRWTVTAIAVDRCGFAQETMDMMTALKVRIGQENSVLYPLALESGCMALRALPWPALKSQTA